MHDIDLLKGLAAVEAERVLALGRRVVLTTGAELFHLGDVADSIYVVTRGKVRLTLPMQVRSKEENVLVEERSSGQSVGWSAMTPPYRFGAAGNRGHRAPARGVEQLLCGASGNRVHGRAQCFVRGGPAIAGLPDDVAARGPAGGGVALCVDRR